MSEMPNQEILDQWRESQRNRGPEQELRDTISSAIWHAANRTLGALEITNRCGNDCCIPGVTVPAWDLETYKAQHADGELQKRKHLEAIRLAVMVGQDPQPWIVNAKATAGASWTEIGAVLGVSRQAAQQRFGERVQQIIEGSDYYRSKAAK